MSTSTTANPFTVPVSTLSMVACESICAKQFIAEAAATEAPEASDQELVLSSPISEVEEPSTQEIEDIEELDIENDESLVVENRNKQSKIKKILNYLTAQNEVCRFEARLPRVATQAPRGGFWMHNVNDLVINTWRGIAFEEVCFNHI